MLNDYPLTPRLPASDIDRARAWYREKLGLTPSREDEIGGLWYQTGGAWFHVYSTPHAGTARNTAAGWQVERIEALMEELRARGVVFEEYDFGEAKTENGLLTAGGSKLAWFTDSEGNIFELSDVSG
jgi:catechol 2,3-dioxygenase-like lactoylglutathione lyase family enzyme